MTVRVIARKAQVFEGRIAMWGWLQRSGNQRLLSLAGAAIAAVAVAAWTVFTYFDQGSREHAGPTVQADHEVAAGRDIRGSRITLEGGPDGGGQGKIAHGGRGASLVPAIVLLLGLWPAVAEPADSVTGEHGVATGDDIRDSTITVGLTPWRCRS
jgi:hypothetical protein